jgi:general secretion pathway protein M
VTVTAARLPQRLLALAILAAVIASLWVVMARPMLAVLFTADDDQARSLKLIAAYKRAAADRPALEARLGELRTREAGLAGLIDGATSAIAAGNLQSEVKKVVEGRHGESRSAQNLPSATAEGFEKVAIRYDLSVPMSALEALLYDIETHRPYLFVDGLEISTPENATPDAPGANDPKLAIRLSIGGYRRMAAP